MNLILFALSSDASPEGLQIFNLVANTGAFGLLVVIVTWLGPKLFRDWTGAHEKVGADLKATVGMLIAEQNRREDASRVNLLAFVQREKDAFERREERMYKVLEAGMASTTAALEKMAEAELTQSTMLGSLKDAIHGLTSTQKERPNQA